MPAVQLLPRVLVMFVGVMAGALLLLGLLQWAWGGNAGGGRSDTLLRMGLIMALAAAGGWLLLLRGRPRSSSLAVLGGALLALAQHAWFSGLGVHMVTLSGAALLLAVAGAAAGMRAASWLALAYVLVVVALDWAERQGRLPGAGLHDALAQANRLLAHLLLALGGWLAALALHRVLGGAVQQIAVERERLADLLRIGSDWTWETDARGRPTYLSPSFESRTGRSVAEFMRWGQPGGPQLIDDADARLQREDLRARRPFRDRVLNYRCTDGHLLSTSHTGEPRFDARGELIGWRGVGRDISRERALQREQQRSQAMLDRLVHMSPDPIVVARLNDGAILLANAGFVAFTGLDDAAVQGRTGLTLGIWRDPAEPLRLREALKATGIVRDLRSVAYTVDGQPRDMLLTAAAFDWHGDRVAVIHARDVTEIDRARREGDAILDNASVGIALVRERRFERVNPKWGEIFALDPAALLGQSTALMFADAQRHASFADYSDSLQARDGQLDIERELRLRDGRSITVHLRARPVDAARPREGGSIWVAEDITERQRVARELAEAKLQADAASQAKSAFLATMSHEIRTPLNGVLGLARLLQTPGLDEARRREYLSHMVDAAEQLTGIVSDVLDLSKIEAGHLELENIEFGLHGLVTSTFRSFAALGRERGLQMHCRIGTGVPQLVRGDPVRVRQILSNYLSNALKFTPRGSIALEVSALVPDRVRFVVRDSGPGVSAALRERLFKPFAQADSSTTRRFGGTGLGLSICRQLATRMGGEVGVHGHGTQGSSFWAELPLPPAFGSDDDLLRSDAASQLLAGQRILVAEDNPVNMLIVSALLERLGAQVLAADNGEAAVNLAREHATTLHAVLMDLHMPGIDGLAATRLLRADARTAALPVIALSAAVLEHERRQVVAAGMNGFVAKPVGEAELLRVLLPLRQAAAGGASTTTAPPGLHAAG
ncbi:ATP-binding protein [Aquabacterium sp. OR-4]|uniref:ATP-binding protein n=1 Tax=Aquabacterium sp. OR-4 TaxID=2978127 RepID=UPI0028CADEC4|nr:ATP-binding protein [Aquabacterium sp. OR-4]MDT7838114.1 PAS domain S-box protein [Aquabacterium sp. OR-4]